MDTKGLVDEKKMKTGYIPISKVENRAKGVMVTFGDLEEEESDDEYDFDFTEESIEIEEEQVMVGYMRKRGRHLKSWKKRWFVLTHEHFSYYKRATDREPIRSVNVSDIEEICVIPPGEFNRYLLLLIETPRRTFLLKHVDDNGDTRVPWRNAKMESSSLLIERWRRAFQSVISIKKGTPVPQYEQDAELA